MSKNVLADERRRADDTVIDMLREKITSNETKIDDHVKSCAKLQKWQIVILCVVVMLIEGHSPEMAKVFAAIGQIVIP